MSALLTGHFDPTAIAAAISGAQEAERLLRLIRSGDALADDLCNLLARAAADEVAGSRPIAADPRSRAMARRIQRRLEAAEREAGKQ